MDKINFKSLTILFCISILMLSTACKKDAKADDKQSKNIKIICEDTVWPMVSDLVRDYNLNNDSMITVETLERGNAFSKLSNSEVDVLIGYVQPNNTKIEAEMLAFDGIGIIVNTSNKISVLGTQQLKQIYTGKIISWEKLKGEALTIIPVAFNNVMNSVQQEFDLKIMDTPIREQMSNNMKYVSSVEEMKNFVAQNKNAIGFMSGQWYNKESKFLKLSGIEITISNLKNQLYSLRFPIKIYYSKEKKENLDDLFQYFKSEDGKKIIRKYCIEAF